jgi:5-methyltetrahydropteroyltriglutamate--homocysteine methyltransferase
MRRGLHQGAHVMQSDGTAGRLSITLDPTRRLLHRVIDRNHVVLARFAAEERTRLGVHTCPGADRHSAHRAAVDDAERLPRVCARQATHVYRQVARARPHACPAHDAGPGSRGATDVRGGD